MRERVVTFGSHGGLVGVVSEPDPRLGPASTAIVLFNVGLNHHVGPHRINVDLARRVAERGFLALRFDLSGLGDSEPRKDNRSDEQRAILDVKEAIAFLADQKGIDDCIVVGLCSGVDPAHAVALSESRVRGAIFIDGYAYTTRRYHVHQALDRATRIFVKANYTRWFRRVILPLVARRPASINDATPIFDRSFPPVEQFKTDLKALLDRGVQTMFLYTRNAYFFNHRGQFAEMIGVQSVPHGVTVQHQLGADHVFTSVTERAHAVDNLAGWIETHFGPATRELEAAS